MNHATTKVLRRALANGIWRISRSRIEADVYDAYVHQIGGGWLCIQPVRDRVDFDGYELLRVEDVTDIRPCPRGDFFAKVLTQRGLAASSANLTMDSLETALASIAGPGALAAFHREVVDPDTCEVGRVVSISRASLRLRCVDLDGREHAEEVRIALRDLTRVGFGGGYEAALAMAARAGERP